MGGTLPFAYVGHISTCSTSTRPPTGKRSEFGTFRGRRSEKGVTRFEFPKAPGADFYRNGVDELKCYLLTCECGVNIFYDRRYLFQNGEVIGRRPSLRRNEMRSERVSHVARNFSRTSIRSRDDAQRNVEMCRFKMFASKL